RQDRAGVGHRECRRPPRTDACPGSGSVTRRGLQAVATAPVTGRKNGGVLRTRREEIAMASVPSREERFSRPEPAPRRRANPVLLILVVPLIGVLLPWIYNTRSPE